MKKKWNWKPWNHATHEFICSNRKSSV